MKKKRYHDHRTSVWLIAGGNVVWCYVCGAWRYNKPGRQLWCKPTGDATKTPAMVWVTW